jgi:hypothetical protein
MAKTEYPSAPALLNYQRQYQEAADHLSATRPGLTEATYYLYFHAVESLLKAYLRAHGKEMRGHNIKKLHAAAQQLGLKVPRDKSGTFSLQNVVALLQNGNEDFRYFNRRGRSKPGMAWTKDIVGELIAEVKTAVESSGAARKPEPIKLDIVWSEPR